MVKDPSHPSRRLFSLLPYGKQYRIAKSRTKRLFNSFYPQAIRLQNRYSNGYLDYLHCVPPPNPSFTLLLLSVYHICIVTFNYTFMYILPQLARPTSAPAHWLTGLSALCPTTRQPLFYATATICSSYMYSHINHTHMYILPQ